MFRWAPYPFLRIALVFGGGIFTYLQLGKRPDFVVPLFALLLAAYLLLWLGARRYRSGDLNNLAGLAGLGAVFLAGLLATHLHTARTYADNLLHQPGPVSHYVGVVDDYLTRKPNSVSTTLALTRVRVNGAWRPVSGRVRLTLARDSGQTVRLSYGEVLLVRGAPAIVPPPANPNQFNYQQYLARQQVYHQHYIYPGQYRPIGYAPASRVVAASIRVRDHLDQQLRRYIPSGRAYGVATALVLGIRDYLPEDLKTTYAQTGTMHVLAVSGLHVALLFFGLNLLIGRLPLGKRGRVIAFILLLGVIWGYAFLTALSASVLRAVVMFSMIQAARTFRLPANIYNTLAAAAFLLLLCNPYFLVDVGFQLSFLAVYGIVYFQPLIYHRLQFSSWLGNESWKLLSTSLAAQLAVLPLSFYYFHQFPVYFLLANLAAVVLSNVALALGFLVLALSWLPPLAAAIGWLVYKVLALMNGISVTLLQLPLPVISNITVSAGQALMLYALILSLALFLVRRKLAYLLTFTLVLVLFSGQEVVRAQSARERQLFIVYRVRGGTAMGFVQGSSATLLADTAFYADPKQFRYAVQPHWQALGIRRQAFDTLAVSRKSHLAGQLLPGGHQLISWRGLRIFVAHGSLRQYRLQSLRLDYLVLTRNAFFYPENLPNPRGQFSVIMDGSNKTWYRARQAETLRKLGFQVTDVPAAGALVWTRP